MMLQADMNAFSVDQLKAICIEESNKVKITY